MTNEELLQRLAGGDESALEMLCESNRGLIRSRALRMARRFNCIRLTERGAYTDYTKEMLSELESVGMLALIKCVRGGKYESNQAAFSTYIVPFLDAAMRRYLEKDIGTLSLDKKSMALVRKAQRLYADRKPVASIAAELGITTDSVARAVSYPIHFLSVYDLALPEDGNDVYDYIAADLSAIPPQQLVYRKIRMEYFREMFFSLPRKDQDILGKCYGVFGYRRESLSEIAMYHMMKESAVEKAKNRALAKLREMYSGSRMQIWTMIHKFIDDAILHT